MAVFASAQQLYEILQKVFERVATDPEMIAPFTHSNLVIRLFLTEPDAEVLLDGRQPPLEVFYGVCPGQANVEVTMSADLLHSMWMNEVSTTAAFFSGRIKSKGNIMRASQFIDLFRYIEEVYPSIAAEYHLTSSNAD